MELVNWINDNGVMALIIWYGFNAVVNSAPKPGSAPGIYMDPGYAWAHRFAMIFAGDINDLLEKSGVKESAAKKVTRRAKEDANAVKKSEAKKEEESKP